MATPAANATPTAMPIATKTAKRALKPTSQPLRAIFPHPNHVQHSSAPTVQLSLASNPRFSPQYAPKPQATYGYMQLTHVPTVQLPPVPISQLPAFTIQQVPFTAGVRLMKIYGRCGGSSGGGSSGVGRRGGNRAGVPNYSDHDLDALLEIVEEKEPLGANHWVCLLTDFRNGRRKMSIPVETKILSKRSSTNWAQQKKHWGSYLSPSHSAS